MCVLKSPGMTQYTHDRYLIGSVFKLHKSAALAGGREATRGSVLAQHLDVSSPLLLCCGSCSVKREKVERVRGWLSNWESAVVCRQQPPPFLLKTVKTLQRPLRTSCCSRGLVSSVFHFSFQRSAQRIVCFHPICSLLLRDSVQTPPSLLSLALSLTS